VRSGATVPPLSVRPGAVVPRLSAWPGAAVQRFAAPDAVPWPDAVAAEPDGTPVRPAAPLREAVRGGPWGEAVRDGPLREAVRGGPWREAAQGVPLPEAVRGGPWPEAAQDEPWRAAAPRVGPRPLAVRAFCALAQTNPRSPRPP